MEKQLPLEECSISQIYLDAAELRTYVIPIYQRNYAWEEDEITVLVKDIYDSLGKDGDMAYYIGTLVTFKRGDNEYEVIDGQQRLTTVYILLKALGIKNFSSKLTYGARKASAATIVRLDDYPNLGEEVDNGIRNGYKYAEKAITNIIDPGKRKEFENYLLNNVKLIHYQVPKDVELNHYFEVMNSRGEQLEKHEIVKSKLSQKLRDRQERATFCRIWESCSEMNVYIQQALPDTTIFGQQMQSFEISDFGQIPPQNNLEGTDTIINFITNPTAAAGEVKSVEVNDRFQPIIDYPNFLLTVLKLTRMQSKTFNPIEFTLDDKELLDEFDAALKEAENGEQFVKDFAFNLLKAKYLLDNYVVHHVLSDQEHTGDNPWKLQSYYQETSNRKYPKNISANQDIQRELVHLLSMFEVSFTPKQRKNYLFYCLMFLSRKTEILADDYLAFLQSLGAKYFLDVYLNKDFLNERNQPVPNAFDQVLLRNNQLDVDYSKGKDYKQEFTGIYREGRADIPLYVFNYMDYMLWKYYADTLRGNKTKRGSEERNAFFSRLGCSDFDLDAFNNFYFSRTRKSLEHYYPQSKAVEDDMVTNQSISKSQINCFGNFAMIGSEANSSGSDLDPRNKLERYSDKKADPVSVASLKFRIMMQMCYDNQRAMLSGEVERAKGMEWNWEDIQRHQANMLDIIFRGI